MAIKVFQSSSVEGVGSMDNSKMSRRYRLSDRLSGTLPAISEGTLDRRFFPYFDYLLDSEHSPEEQSDFYDVYVDNPDFEERLKKRITSPRTQITAITGARGIGKSTNIRFFFGVSTQPKILSESEIFSRIPHNRKRPEPNENDQYLIVPFYLDTHNASTENLDRILTSQILSAAELVSRERGIEFSESKLYDFVNTHKSQLVTYSELPIDATPPQRIEHFRKVNPYGYVTELMKYTLHMSDISRVVLIVDDIESCSYEVQKGIVLGILKLRDCLKNVGNLKRSYVPDYIFTCRPATFTLLRSDSEIDGFSVGHPIEIKRPADLREIVKKRFEYAVKVIGAGKSLANMGALADVKNRTSWDEAYEAFEHVVDNVTSSYGPLIVDLCNHDVRRALIDLQESLRNSRWYEKYGHDQGAFVVDINRYHYSATGIIRALVLRDREYYSEELDSILPNLFFNRENNEADLMLMHIIKYFFEATRSNRVVSIDKSRLKSALWIAYKKEDIDEYFDEIIGYALKTEIVREEIVKSKGGRNKRYLIPMNKGFSLWKNCASASIFIEFFRDNTFLEHDIVKYYPQSRARGTCRLDSETKFIVSADFISEIAAAEAKIIKFIRDKRSMEKYIRSFGKRSISRQLLWGLNHSIRRYYRSLPKQPKPPKEVRTAASNARFAVSDVKIS